MQSVIQWNSLEIFYSKIQNLKQQRYEFCMLVNFVHWSYTMCDTDMKVVVSRHKECPSVKVKEEMEHIEMQKEHWRKKL